MSIRDNSRLKLVGPADDVTMENTVWMEKLHYALLDEENVIEPIRSITPLNACVGFSRQSIVK